MKNKQTKNKNLFVFFVFQNFFWFFYVIKKNKMTIMLDKN